MGSLAANYVEVVPFNRNGSVGVTERRKNPRALLHWTILLNCGSSVHPVRTTTRDISKDGFYSLLKRPLGLGEHIDCDIVVPTHRSQDPDDVVYLRCRV